MNDLSIGLQQLLAALDRREIPYFVGGSVASGVHGLPRMTQDIDLIVDFSGVDVEELVKEILENFYADLEDANLAVESGRSFNVIHLKTAQKFDLFPLRREPFAALQMQRRQHLDLTPLDMPGVEASVASAEDTILAKLIWFRAGGESSEKQWHDLMGVLKVQGPRLDRDYLDGWALQLGVSDLLKKLETELAKRTQ